MHIRYHPVRLLSSPRPNVTVPILSPLTPILQPLPISVGSSSAGSKPLGSTSGAIPDRTQPAISRRYWGVTTEVPEASASTA